MRNVSSALLFLVIVGSAAAILSGSARARTITLACAKGDKTEMYSIDFEKKTVQLRSNSGTLMYTVEAAIGEDRILWRWENNYQLDRFSGTLWAAGPTGSTYTVWGQCKSRIE